MREKLFVQSSFRSKHQQPSRGRDNTATPIVAFSPPVLFALPVPLALMVLLPPPPPARSSAASQCICSPPCLPPPPRPRPLVAHLPSSVPPSPVGAHSICSCADVLPVSPPARYTGQAARRAARRRRYHAGGAPPSHPLPPRRRRRRVQRGCHASEPLAKPPPSRKLGSTAALPRCELERHQRWPPAFASGQLSGQTTRGGLLGGLPR